ncbi:MAG: hypothetical protein ACLQVI_32800 [Polyangiaceae bacterium]
MTNRSRSWRGGLAMAVLGLAVLGCPGIRQDELECEDAVSLLQECCPGFVASNVDCTYTQGSCEAGTIYPEISISQAECIRSESCQELRSSGVCARAIAVPAGTTWSDNSATAPEDDSGPPAYPQVCP